jgi:pantoate--beta-alanine ligase
MIRISSASEITALIEEYKAAGKTIGFTPTMGALHAGHHSLINLSKEHNDISICSIFVNPTQFNNADDLTKYPRTIEADCAGLEEIGCDIVFLPTIEEIYPGGEENFTVDINLNGLDTLMEGEHRPGHFAGVVQVVKRLLDIVPASGLYMGQKDYQQFTIIRHIIKTLEISTELVVCPIVREADGLAMSSRNARLTADHRARASMIHKTLNKAKEMIHTNSIESIQSDAMTSMNIPGFKPEYFTIINGHTLETIESISGVKEVVACTAVWAGEVRLIDNMRLIVEDETSTT